MKRSVETKKTTNLLTSYQLSEKPSSHVRRRQERSTISFPEAAILLVSDGDRDLWPDGILHWVRKSRTSGYTAQNQGQTPNCHVVGYFNALVF